MNLLKLPPEWKAFLVGLDDPKDIWKYSESRLQNYRQSSFPDKPPPIKKKPTPVPEEKSSDKNRTKRKWSPDVIAVEIDEEVSPIDLEGLRKLIQKAVLLKIKDTSDM
jgi:hypothetical protein